MSIWCPTCQDALEASFYDHGPGVLKDHCEHNFYEFASQPYLHSGLCEDGGNNYLCVWMGSRFTEIHWDFDALSFSKTSHNNTTFKDTVVSYIFHCWHGNMGTLCETDISEWCINPCQFWGKLMGWAVIRGSIGTHFRLIFLVQIPLSQRLCLYL